MNATALADLSADDLAGADRVAVEQVLRHDACGHQQLMHEPQRPGSVVGEQILRKLRNRLLRGETEDAQHVGQPKEQYEKQQRAEVEELDPEELLPP